VKYRLQPRALPVPVTEAFGEPGTQQRLLAAFERQYAGLYGENAGYSAAGVEIMKCRVDGSAAMVLPRLVAEDVPRARDSSPAFKFSRVATGRTEIVAAMRGFHGRTMGALSATWNKAYREPFMPLVPGFHHVPYNNLGALDQAVTADTSAVILEIVQGEGGVFPGTREYLQGAQTVCRRNGTLLIIDEVQTALGRTGKMFAFQHYDLQPDLVCVAKSIAGGLPMGALLIGEAVGVLPGHIHGSTFGGNPLACATSLAALDEIERLELPRRAAENGEYFLANLRQIDAPVVREVRGLGLLVGIELRRKAAPFLQVLMEDGVLALTAGMNVIRFLPPLVITREQLDRVTGSVAHVLAQLVV